MKHLLFAATMLATAALAGCLDDDKSPYVELRGGGFQFNYRIAEATATVVLGTLRTLPATCSHHSCPRSESSCATLPGGRKLHPGSGTKRHPRAPRCAVVDEGCDARTS